LSPLKGMPITVLFCESLDPNLELLRSLKGLQWINGQMAAVVIGQLAAFQPDAKKELSVAGLLTAEDPFDRLRPGCHYKVHEFKMKAGIQYIIDLIRVLPVPAVAPIPMD